MKSLASIIAAIQPINQALQKPAQQKIDGLLKPYGSLGYLENLAIQLACISETIDIQYPNKKIIVMCADHGVYAENIASSPQSVTFIQALNMQKGKTGVCVFAKLVGATVLPVDVGIDCEPIPNMLSHKTRKQSGNIAKEPAMTHTEAINLLTFSANLVLSEVEKGMNILGVGEMGIANTTPAAAIVSVLTQEDAANCVGIGANYPHSLISHKIKIVEQAIAINPVDPENGIDVLAKIGGFDLCGMAGLMLGAACAKIPIVLDGFLSYASALAAIKINPLVRDYLIPSHTSAEKGAFVALNALNLTPSLNMSLRLGEGSGAALAFPLIDAACVMMTEMGSLAEDSIILQEI